MPGERRLWGDSGDETVGGTHVEWGTFCSEFSLDSSFSSPEKFQKPTFTYLSQQHLMGSYRMPGADETGLTG